MTTSSSCELGEAVGKPNARCATLADYVVRLLAAQRRQDALLGGGRARAETWHVAARVQRAVEIRVVTVDQNESP